MPETIVEVHSISSAHGWYVRSSGHEQLDEFSSAEALEDLVFHDPVLCFALVSVIDPDYLDLGSNKRVIAITKSMDHIVGEVIADCHTDLMFIRSK